MKTPNCDKYYQRVSCSLGKVSQRNDDWLVSQLGTDKKADTHKYLKQKDFKWRKWLLSDGRTENQTGDSEATLSQIVTTTLRLEGQREVVVLGEARGWSIKQKLEAW